jgi:eukaryotic-like serine/threonine-protein kinase
MDLLDDSKSQPQSAQQNSGSELPSKEVAGDEDQAKPASNPLPGSIPSAEVTDTFSFPNRPLLDDRSSVKLLAENGFEKERTVISQRPAAAPNENYKNVPLTILAEMLEGRQLDHFLVQRIVGGGGMGAVFRGIDQRLDRVVAIKVIPGSKRDLETLRRFRTEAQAAARLDHPNIARVYYVGEAEQWNYIVFEFIDGVNVRDLVEIQGPLSIDDAVFYTRQVAEALQHAHERDVVHRDIKPSNILVTPSGMAKLVDMGLARDTSMDKSTKDQTASGVTLGTFDYISPEQARDPRDADVRSDMYSLGCSLFFMLTAHPPFPEGTALQKLLNHGSLPPPDPRGWREDISDQLYEILMKLMAKRPTDRYQKPVELVNDLLLLAEHENLPRSLGPSTITLSPSVSQPTLLEAHLPWIVATIVLLGSTIWLHSRISLATGFAFPKVSFPGTNGSSTKTVPANNNAQSVNSGTLPVPPATSVDTSTAAQSPLPNPTAEPIASGLGNTSTSTSKNLMLEPAVESLPPSTALPTKPLGIVVSATQPTEIATDGWEPSLERAIQRLSNQNGAVEIEVRGSIMLDRAIEISEFSELTIRGANAESRIDVIRSLWNPLVNGSPAFRVVDSSLQLRGIQVRCIGLEPNQSAASRSLFQFVGNSALTCNSVEFTLQGEKSSVLHMVSIGDLSNRPASSSDSHAVRLMLSNCLVRGIASVFKISQSSQTSMDTVQVRLANSVVAVTGRVVDLVGANGDTGVDRIVRMYCEQSSFIAEDGFAQLEYVGQGQPIVGFSRSSQACVFWSKTDVPHIRILGENVDPSETPDQIMLQGMDNAYDQNLVHLCTFGQNNVKTESRSIQDGQLAGWYAERGTERILRWKVPPSSLTSLMEARPTDFQLQSTHFVPGYRTTSPQN